MSHLFISYARQDSEFANQVKDILESKQVKVWIDTDRLQVGIDWRGTIDTAIDEAFAVIVIMSPDANTSNYVTYEWSYAWGAKKTIIPIL